MRIRSVGAVWFGLAVALAPLARAQAAAPTLAFGRANAVALARLRVAPDSNATARRSWSGTGAIVGGVGGGVAFAVAFYHFIHRTGAINNASGTLGGTLVGVAVGAVGGALFGAFLGSLFPKRREPTATRPA
jgi:hypothetical protein